MWDYFVQKVSEDGFLEYGDPQNPGYFGIVYGLQNVIHLVKSGKKQLKVANRQVVECIGKLVWAVAEVVLG